MLTGILLLDKPLGLSSNSALQRVKRMLRAEKAGHVGSLDPLATGCSRSAWARATKIAGEILSGRKRYLFTIALGSRTATGDVEGAVVETQPVPAFDRASLDATLSRFMGKQTQIPPMYSAIKRDGQPLYKLARAGVEVDRAPRDIEIFEFSVLGFDATSVKLETSCAKGTYIRTLAEDIAKALGTCGHVALLRRLHVEPFEHEPMVELDAVSAFVQAGQMPPLLSADRGVPHLPEVRLSPSATARVRHGQPAGVAAETAPGRVRLYDGRGEFFGIGEADGFGSVQPRRLFVDPAPEDAEVAVPPEPETP
ncbi:MAG: tRNA pseudouridine(55) synthase TruB [Gammaproteobacteria bacterium]